MRYPCTCPRYKTHCLRQALDNPKTETRNPKTEPRNPNLETPKLRRNPRATHFASMSRAPFECPMSSNESLASMPATPIIFKFPQRPFLNRFFYSPKVLSLSQSSIYSPHRPFTRSGHLNAQCPRMSRSRPCLPPRLFIRLFVFPTSLSSIYLPNVLIVFLFPQLSPWSIYSPHCPLTSVLAYMKSGCPSTGFNSQSIRHFFSDRSLMSMPTLVVL